MADFIKPGFHINAVSVQLPSEFISRAGTLPTPNISDSLGKLVPACVSLKPMHAVAHRMAGRAVTVLIPPGDNLMVHKAIASAEPGDVVVVDAGGVLEQAIVGEIMTAWARQRGLAGMVIYGAIRDVDIVGKSDFPVYACGYAHRGPYRDGPGELNVPIALGGMIVSPGDLVVGDSNGVVVVPYALIAPTLARAATIAKHENELVDQIASGGYAYDWIDKTLIQRGYAL